MVRRYAVAVCVVALILTGLVAPASAGDSAADGVGVDLSAGDGVDAHVLERLRAASSSIGLHRADTEGVLEQSTRAAIYAALQESPGASLAGVAAAVGVTKSTVRYHVDVLRRAGVVDTTEVAGETRVATAENDVEAAAATSAESTGRILAAVAEHEPASVTEIATTVDRAPSTVSHHLAALADRDLVQRERDGEAVLTTLAPSTRVAMGSGEPALADD